MSPGTSLPPPDPPPALLTVPLALHMVTDESNLTDPTKAARIRVASHVVVNAAMDPARVRSLTGTRALLLPSFNSHMMPWYPENAFYSALAAQFTSNRDWFYPDANSPGTLRLHAAADPFGHNAAGDTVNLEFRANLALAKHYAEVIAPLLAPWGNVLYLDDAFSEAPPYLSEPFLNYWLPPSGDRTEARRLFNAYWSAYIEALVRLLVDRYGIRVWANSAGPPPRFAQNVCIEGPGSSHVTALDAFLNCRGESIAWFFEPRLDVPGLCVPGEYL